MTQAGSHAHSKKIPPSAHVTDSGIRKYVLIVLSFTHFRYVGLSTHLEYMFPVHVYSLSSTEFPIMLSAVYLA